MIYSTHSAAELLDERLRLVWLEQALFDEASQRLVVLPPGQEDRQNPERRPYGLSSTREMFLELLRIQVDMRGVLNEMLWRVSEKDLAQEKAHA